MKLAYTANSTNRYVSIMDIWDPDGSIRIAPLYANQSVDMLVEELRGITKGAEFRSMLISDILLGKLCNRRFDNKYSPHYENLIKSGAVVQEDGMDYK